MITIRPAHDRGTANFGWLDSRHSFSFGSYYDPQHIGFGNLRVINEDKVMPGRGFDTHSHRDMEIITYMLSGALAHKDSVGNSSVIRPGDVQRMSAGTGIHHSEYNASELDPVHFLQIWIQPNEFGIEPSYEEGNFTLTEHRDQLVLIGSNDGRNSSVKIHQTVDLYAAVLSDGGVVNHTLTEGQTAWIQVARGSLELNSETLITGDGAAIEQVSELNLIGRSADAEFLLFDLQRG